MERNLYKYNYHACFPIHFVSLYYVYPYIVNQYFWIQYV